MILYIVDKMSMDLCTPRNEKLPISWGILRESESSILLHKVIYLLTVLFLFFRTITFHISKERILFFPHKMVDEHFNDITIKYRILAYNKSNKCTIDNNQSTCKWKHLAVTGLL